MRPFFYNNRIALIISNTVNWNIITLDLRFVFAFSSQMKQNKAITWIETDTEDQPNGE